MVRQMNSVRFAERAWRLIQYNPADINIRRGSTFLDAQTVRVETSNAQVERQGDSAAVAVLRDAVIFGVRGHATEADTDIKRNDLFEYDGQDYRVMDINKVVGGIQASCEVIA